MMNPAARSSGCKVVSFQAVRRRERRERLYVVFALIPQYLALGTLVLYGLLRLALTPQVPFSYYIGPLTMLWPLAYLFLLVSYVADKLLWEE